MSTKTSSDLIEGAGGARSEPGGRAQRPAGGVPMTEVELPQEIRDRLSDEVIDELLAGARTGEEIVGPGGVERAWLEILRERHPGVVWRIVPRQKCGGGKDDSSPSKQRPNSEERSRR